jgi:hypothetical protein
MTIVIDEKYKFIGTHSDVYSLNIHQNRRLAGLCLLHSSPAVGAVLTALILGHGVGCDPCQQLVEAEMGRTTDPACEPAVHTDMATVAFSIKYNGYNYYSVCKTQCGSFVQTMPSGNIVSLHHYNHDKI